MNIHEHLERLKAPADRPAGMYLRLEHGRADPREALSDWGENGPIFGPLKYCHITYMATINLCGIDEIDGTGPLGQQDPMHFVADLLYYDGMYYGDWELEYHDGK
jgi:hypothetical protein